MRKIKMYLSSLPSYFKIIIVIIFLLNLSGTYGLYEKRSVDVNLNNMFTLFLKVSGDVEVQNGELIASKQLYKEDTFELGILTEPKSRNFIYLNKSDLVFSIDGQKKIISYDTNMSNAYFQQSIIDMASNLSVSTFFLSTLQMMFLVSIIILAMIISTLILSKFKLKLSQIVSSIFFSVPIGSLAGIICCVFISTYVQIFLFVIVTGTIYAKSIHKTFDKSVTSYYLGEGAYK